MNSSVPANLRTMLATAALGSISLAGVAQGVVTASLLTDTAPGPHVQHQSYTPLLFSSSGEDLAEGLTATVSYVGGTGNVNEGEARGIEAWTDGSITTVYNQSGNQGDAVDHHAYGVVNSNPNTGLSTLITFNLGGSFNLSSIDVFLGWPDGGRDDHSFNVLVSADGVTFTPIDGASYTKGNPGHNNPAVPVTHRVRIEDSEAADIASNVQYVQFQVTDSDNGWGGVAEIDIFGQAVPEPGVAVLGLLGGLSLLRRRRF